MIESMGVKGGGLRAAALLATSSGYDSLANYHDRAAVRAAAAT